MFEEKFGVKKLLNTNIGSNPSFRWFQSLLFSLFLAVVLQTQTYARNLSPISIRARFNCLNNLISNGERIIQAVGTEITGIGK